MTPLNSSDILPPLHWRYATKTFDTSRKIPDDQWATLEATLVLSPSSFGLQPWKFLVIKDTALREKLVPISWNQSQVKDASHLVVFAARTGLTVADVDRYVARIAEVRKAPIESLAGYRGVMAGFATDPKYAADMPNWAKNQVYIALGFLMAAAAMMGIDTCPMEGIEPPKYDELLGLTYSGYTTVCVCPVGYRAADDKYAASPKVRYPAGEVIEHR